MTDDSSQPISYPVAGAISLVPATPAPQNSQFHSQPGLTDHTHNGFDSSPVDQNNILNGPRGSIHQYYAQEFDNGSVTTKATINWLNGNVQYITLTGNTTFKFINPKPGTRLILMVAGAFTPTWPSTVKWPGNTTPTPTASAGKKDIYGFIYSGKEALYNGAQAANYPTS